MPAVLLLLLFFASLVEAATPLNVQSLAYQGTTVDGTAASEDQISMPFVTGGAPGVATSINEQLFQGQFTVAAPTPADGHFTLPDGASAEGTASQTFSVSRNDERILSIAFDNEGCGAYCESYKVYYSFDVQTGRKLAPELIFTAEGLRSLEQQLNRAKRAAHRQQLVALRTELKEAYSKRQADAVSDLQERITLNSECIGDGQHTDRTPRVTETVKGFGYDKYEFAEKTFRLTRERCSNHALRALDDVGDYTLELPYAALAPYLTDEGRRLLLDQPVAATAKPSAKPPAEKTTTENSTTEKTTVRVDEASDEAVLFFPAPLDSTAGLAWNVGGDQVPAGEGWWVLACEQACTLYAATLQVSDATVSGTGEETLPARQLQWSPVPAGQVIAIMKAGSNAALKMKAGAVKTWLHAALEEYPPASHADTMEIAIPLDGAQTASLVPRVTSAGAEQIDRLELRIGSQRQALPGVKLASTDELLDEKQVLRWAGDLDGDGKLDLILGHDNQQVDVALYLSSLAQPGELLGLAGSMRYEQSSSGE